MASIDRFINALFSTRADQIILASGEPAIARRGTTSRKLTSGVLSEKLVTQLLEEIAPAGVADGLAESGARVFVHATPQGPVAVTARRDADQVSLELAAETEPPASGTEEPAVVDTARATEGEAPTAGAEAPAAGAQAPAAERVVPAAAADPASALGVMEALLHEMVEQGCSDLHLSSESPPLFRKDGSIQTLSSGEAFSADRVREVLDAITPPGRKEQFEELGDSDFSYEIEGLARFRCNRFLDRKGPGAVFRVIPAEILTAEQLGLSEHILGLCKLTRGLVVVTGPTGSGKSTTLAAMVDHINRHRSDHIITIEDPIEFVHPNKKCLINQREIGSHTRGFKPALRAALREDPDIVLVGEMRDLETVEIAIETAETGHLVFGTLHTNTAASTVDRVIDQFPTDRQGQIRAMLASSLRGVIAQTLCRKEGGGRVAALEVLMVNPAVSNLIREGKTFQIPSIMQTGRRQGMVMLQDALIELVEKGTVAAEEAYRRASDAEEFARLLTARGIPLEVAAPPE